MMVEASGLGTSPLTILQALKLESGLSYCCGDSLLSESNEHEETMSDDGYMV